MWISSSGRYSHRGVDVNAVVVVTKVVDVVPPDEVVVVGRASSRNRRPRRGRRSNPRSCTRSCRPRARARTRDRRTQVEARSRSRPSRSRRGRLVEVDGWHVASVLAIGLISSLYFMTHHGLVTEAYSTHTNHSDVVSTGLKCALTLRHMSAHAAYAKQTKRTDRNLKVPCNGVRSLNPSAYHTTLTSQLICPHRRSRNLTCA
eukprot:SAG11_NODE_1032_length_6107_cov_3.885819_5_plen_203_part_00